MKPLLYAITLLVAFLGGNLQAQIYADFTVSHGESNLGTFRVRLDYDKAPRTCANFIGLATGQKAWLDITTGKVVTGKKYYDGLTFHRLDYDFMIQGGDPLGTGGGGPGYGFQDEFHNDLRHNGRYILSMANSGINTNGSQFFITLENASWLDDKHSVFGEVVEDVSFPNSRVIIDNFTNSATFPVTGDKLDDPVVIESIVINRVGTEAQNFDENAYGLPKIVSQGITVNHAGDLIELNVTQPSASITKYSYSTDLNNWQWGDEIYKDTEDQTASKIDVTSVSSGKNKLFYNVAQVDHQDSGPLWVRSWVGKTLTIQDSLLIPQLNGTWIFTFTSETGGTVVNGTTTGTFSINRYGFDWFGSQEYLQTDIVFLYQSDIETEPQSYDVNFYIKLGRDQYSETHFFGRHSGTIYLSQSGISGPTSGLMSLTR
jgi:peptidyl-prolyl cis-trans isomerase A (cyclophilin A)